MSKGVIFQEPHVVGGDIIQLITFVCAFYAFKSTLFYNHYNHEGRCYWWFKSGKNPNPKSPYKGESMVIRCLKNGI